MRNYLSEWDWSELMAFIMEVEPPEEPEQLEELQNDFCERFGISDVGLCMQLMDKLLLLTIPVESVLAGGAHYHAFVDVRRGVMIVRVPAEEVRS